MGLSTWTITALVGTYWLPFYVSARELRHFAAYGSANRYRPVKNCNASGNTAKRPSEAVYFFCATATPLTMTATVKAIDTQRWNWRISACEMK